MTANYFCVDSSTRASGTANHYLESAHHDLNSPGRRPLQWNARNAGSERLDVESYGCLLEDAPTHRSTTCCGHNFPNFRTFLGGKAMLSEYLHDRSLWAIQKKVDSSKTDFVLSHSHTTCLVWGNFPQENWNLNRSDGFSVPLDIGSSRDIFWLSGQYDPDLSKWPSTNTNLNWRST